MIEQKAGFHAKRWFFPQAFLLLLVLLLGFGCHPKPDSQNSKASLVLEARMEVFHFQSQKYKIDQNEVDAEAWVDGMMHLEVVKNPYLNLFNHIGGGGPYSAEWNTDGDLFVRGTFSLPKSALGDFDFRVNGVALKDSIRVIEKGQATLLGIRVPSAFWQAHLKPIQEKNYAYFFQEDDIERIRNEENGGISEMKGLLFELTYGWEGRKMVLRNGVAFGFGE